MVGTGSHADRGTGAYIPTPDAACGRVAGVVFLSPLLFCRTILSPLPGHEIGLMLLGWPLIFWSVMGGTSAGIAVYGFQTAVSGFRSLLDWGRTLSRVFIRTAGMPIQIIHYVTARCNIRCKHCFYKDTLVSPEPGEISLENVDRITSEIGPVLWYSLPGGEPMIRKNLPEVFEIVVRNFRPSVFSFPTNGWYVDRSFETTLKILQQANNVDLILFFRWTDQKRFTI